VVIIWYLSYFLVFFVISLFPILQIPFLLKKKKKKKKKKKFFFKKKNFKKKNFFFFFFFFFFLFFLFLKKTFLLKKKKKKKKKKKLVCWRGFFSKIHHLILAALLYRNKSLNNEFVLSYCSSIFVVRWFYCNSLIPK